MIGRSLALAAWCCASDFMPPPRRPSCRPISLRSTYRWRATASNSHPLATQLCAEACLYLPAEARANHFLPTLKSMNHCSPNSRRRQSRPEEVATEKLQKGQYRLEVQASDSAGRSTVWRTAHFTVE